MDHNADTLNAAKELLGLGECDEEALDVLDLPQLYTKPSARILLTTLADLSSEPVSWEATPRTCTPHGSGTSTPYRKKKKVKSEGLPGYLTKIVSSPLAWIEDDVAKERIWEAASQRLSERSGRTAMGAIERTFVIPLQPLQDQSTGRHSPNETNPHLLCPDACLDLTLHEPALTGDCLGLKTWASSYLLAKRMTLLRTSLPPLPIEATVLELGSGTGLVGLAAAAILSRHVLLTDLPDIVPNLERNAEANAGSLSTHGGQVTCAVLDWNLPQSLHLNDTDNDYAARTFPLILAADPLYSSDHPRLLVNAVRYHLSSERNARVVVELPLRDAYANERNDFRARMNAIGLHIVDEGEEVGYDDWSSNDDEPLEVRCWWTVWAWR
ncbi:Protein-lysine N-methyltransferase rrg1 [Pseudocercospora fuligena]|uniref:Protein-lysine N-methyltransferase rrg1 n=1 Tax=Pseudocercospora fuligena TaxID=685502 RepID=A0A8H6VII4_9PEZI|nr:Protein-lysine N-methyltransferase rrg1 [Pseudocercospora fuligena]